MTKRALADISIVCPRDQSELKASATRLICEAGHAYRVAGGVPILLLDEATATHSEHSRALDAKQIDYELDLDATCERSAAAVDPLVSKIQGATSGSLYKSLIGHLDRYPVPEIRLPCGDGRTLLDIGLQLGKMVNCRR
jgi:uncharacterized protein YbaR (Trm112 family)